MNRLFKTAFAAALLFGTTILSTPVQAEAIVGQSAPAFTATTSNGQSVTLDSLKGKIVVLEWTNDSCPFVVKYYSKGHMQALQKDMTAQNVVWAQVISSAPGKQGHVDGAAADKLNAERGAAPTYTFLDSAGTLGRLYGAKTTPHMFVIDANGVLAYAGAIDDKASTDSDDIEGAKNYVRAAVTELKAGSAVTTPRTKSYGCSIKYND